mmetsp:Transcript_31516/g.78545  ORF Transcript_31516/g.78545 Transcript_31516/m.78545 type:complete len:206 (-) Transcript_31516:403-1020(-)
MPLRPSSSVGAARLRPPMLAFPPSCSCLKNLADFEKSEPPLVLAGVNSPVPILPFLLASARSRDTLSSSSFFAAAPPGCSVARSFVCSSFSAVRRACTRFFFRLYALRSSCVISERSASLTPFFTPYTSSGARVLLFATAVGIASSSCTAGMAERMVTSAFGFLGVKWKAKSASSLADSLSNVASTALCASLTSSGLRWPSTCSA